MTRTRTSRLASRGVMARRRNAGTTLIVAIVLLLILTVFSLAAVRIGLAEQRASGNDYKARLTRAVAEGGLSHARATLSLLDNTLRPGPSTLPASEFWSLCLEDDTSFPCGAEPDPARRARMYRFIGGTDLNGDGATTVFEARSLPLLPIASGGAAAGNEHFFVDRVGSANRANAFPAEYAVGALMCRTARPSAKSVEPTGCTTEPGHAANSVLYTLVSRAALPGESAVATVVTTVAVSPLVATRLVDVVAASPEAASSGEVSGESAGAAGTTDTTVAPRAGVRDGERPCDAFAWALGTAPVRNDSDNDGFCELGPDADHDRLNDRVEAFMSANGASEVDCGDLGPEARGLTWLRQSRDGSPVTCVLPPGDIGQPAHPVILVIDGPLLPSATTKVFGQVFVRDPSLGLSPGATGNGLALPVVRTTHPAVFGSVFLEGAEAQKKNRETMAKARAPFAVDLIPIPSAVPPTIELPGTWTDQYAF